MNNKQEDGDDDDLYTTVEPVISYYSSSSNCGVSTLFSSRQKRPFKQLNMLFTPTSSSCHNSFSLCNTIMLPYITTEESIQSNDSKNNNSNLIHTESGREKENQQISYVKDKTSYNTLSSRIENKEMEEISQQKENDNLVQNNFLFGKNFSYNVTKIKKTTNEIYDRINNKENEENNNNINEKDNNENKDNNKDNDNENDNGDEACDYLLRGKSVRISENIRKNAILEKTEKRKKIKLKSGTLFLKLNNRTKIKKQNNKKIKPSLEKSKSFIDDKNNKKNQKDKLDFTYKIKTSKNCANFLNNKKHNKDNSDIILKKKQKKYYKESSSDDEEENENDDKDKDEEESGMIKIGKKKRSKNEELKRNSNSNRTKMIIDQQLRIKTNKSFHIRPKFNMLKEHMKSKKQDYHNDNGSDSDDEKDKESIEKNININKEIQMKEKKKKYITKKSLITDKEEKDLIKSRKINEKRKTFTIVGLKNIKNFKKQITEIIKHKIKKDKNKEKEKDKDKENNSIFKKEFSSTSKFIHINVEKDLDIHKSETTIRKGRSNSLTIANSNLNEEIDERKRNDDETTNKSVKEAKNKKKINKKVIDFDNALKNNQKKMQFNLFSKDKFTNTEVSNSDYLNYTLNCMDLILDIDIEKQTRLKNKINFNFKKSKKKNIKKKIALFDLDETIVHCTGDIKTTKEKYQHVIEVSLPGRLSIQVGINLRPYWKQTLNLIKKNYHIVIYTASHHAYADAVLDFMDPKKKYFKYRLYRNNCSLIDVEGAKFYVKDLDIFNEHYNLKDIVIVDNSVLSFAYHLHNGIPIVPYYDEDKDGSLYVVGLYLVHIFEEEDLREANKKYINLDSFLEEAKRKREENISFEEDLKEEEEDIYEDKDDNFIINNDNNQSNIENKTNKKTMMNIRDIRSSIKKYSDKRFNFNKIQRKQSGVFETENSNKLKCKSKLLNMYYEVNDDSPKSAHFKKNESFDEGKLKEKKKKSNKNIQNIIIEEKNENADPSIVFVGHNNEDIDCKSDHAFEQNISDNNFEKEEVPMMVRGLTIREDLIQDFKNKDYNDKSGKNIKYKLGILRSNFYNTFKI